MMNNMFYPAQILQMIQSGNNPQQVLMNVMQEMAQNKNPMMANLLDLARNNNTAEIEQIARNACRERGKDFDTEFNSFKRNLGFK